MIWDGMAHVITFTRQMTGNIDETIQLNILLLELQTEIDITKQLAHRQ